MPPPVFRYEFPADFYRSVQIPEVFPKDFQVKVPFQEGHVTVRAIEIHPDRTQTTEKIVEMPVKDGKICWGKQWLPCWPWCWNVTEKTGTSGMDFLQVPA